VLCAAKTLLSDANIQVISQHTLLVDDLNASTCGGKGIVGGNSASVCVLESTRFLELPTGAGFCSVCMVSIRWKLHNAYNRVNPEMV
jgi:hypothetical protein